MSQQGCKLSLREWATDSPSKCKPLVQLTNLISESEMGQSVSSLSLLPEDEAPRSPAAGGWAVTSSFQRIPWSLAFIQGIPGLLSQHCLPETLLSPKANPGKARSISEFLRCLLPQSYFYISFPCIMAIYILQQSAWVSKTQTRNNNASPGASQKPQPRGGFGNQLLKQVVPSPQVGEFSATLDNKWTWWGPHRAVIPAGLHIESCIQRAEPIRGGIVAMNTEGIAVNYCFIAKCFRFPAPAICVLRKTCRSKGPKWGWGGGAGSRLVERTAQLGMQRETQGIDGSGLRLRCDAMQWKDT